jgi:hypothetical protein
VLLEILSEGLNIFNLYLIFIAEDPLGGYYKFNVVTTCSIKGGGGKLGINIVVRDVGVVVVSASC